MSLTSFFVVCAASATTSLLIIMCVLIRIMVMLDARLK